MNTVSIFTLEPTIALLAAAEQLAASAGRAPAARIRDRSRFEQASLTLRRRET
jgi:hypothetical protein